MISPQRGKIQADLSCKCETGWPPQRPHNHNKTTNNMSNTLTQNSMGLTVQIKGCPASALEYDELAGEIGAAVADAISNQVKHVWLSRFRTKVAERLAVETGFPREKVGERKNKDGTVTAVLEKPIDYLNRLCEDKNCEPAEFNPIAQPVADEMPFSSVFVGAPGSGRGRIGKEYLAIADEIMEKVDAAGGDYSAFMDKITEGNPGFTFIIDDSGAPTRESIALAIKLDLDRQKRAALQGFVA